MENTLYHHGTKGMKWGVRRYQNKDGSLTAFGRARRKLKEKRAAQEETVEDKKKRILASRSAKDLYENADLFTTNELQNAYNRLQLERNIASLVPKEVSKAERVTSKAIDWGKKVNDLTDTGTKTYNNVAKVYNAFSEKGRENPLPLIGSNNKSKGNKKKETNEDDD